MNKRLFIYGFTIWLGATLVLRLEGQHLLQPTGAKATLILFALSLPLMAWIVRRLCRAARLPKDQWLNGAVSVALPTLLLDPFSSAFFPVVFPNMAPAIAGLFGGLMLWCCAGAIVGVLIPARHPD